MKPWLKCTLSAAAIITAAFCALDFIAIIPYIATHFSGNPTTNVFGAPAYVALLLLGIVFFIEQFAFMWFVWRHNGNPRGGTLRALKVTLVIGFAILLVTSPIIHIVSATLVLPKLGAFAWLIGPINFIVLLPFLIVQQILLIVWTIHGTLIS